MISIEKALEIANRCIYAHKLMGHLADVPFSQAELCEALTALVKDRDVLAAAETKANRRYAAANARYMKLAKQTGKHVESEEEVET